MAGLFGKNALAGWAESARIDDMSTKLELVRSWHRDYHSGSLRRDKETSREQAFNQDFFIKILGYVEKPASPYTFEPKSTSAKGQYPDAVLCCDPTSRQSLERNISAVVELKGAMTDLDRPQQREGNLSPVQQAFKYKTQYRRCPFVVVSNFFEIRLYNDNQLDFERWTLNDLVDPSGDFASFRKFFVLLCADNLTTISGKGQTEFRLSDVRIKQEEIGRDFYQYYHSARLNLLRDLYRHNSLVKDNVELGIEKTQKIMDRLVFACFAEDGGLLPDNIVDRVVRYAEESPVGSSLWSVVGDFFAAVDVGSRRLGIPEGYNGGLFAHDDVLLSLEVGDSALREVMSLSKYNFTDDLSVSILGHIFEQSITDLEDVRVKVTQSREPGRAIEEESEDRARKRRRRDGIFYTPDHIVRFIVEQTLGRRLRDYEEECKVAVKLNQRTGQAEYERRERQAYLRYQYFLQRIRVLDPACGSGAFLVGVFDYLLAENQRVDAVLGGSLSSQEQYVRQILQGNIYGVDLNEESVEITKLSLWLKTAEKGKKLTALDHNIRCGNSLILRDRHGVEQGFDWNAEFSEVFDEGGFDVVVGNPPYVNARTMSSSDRDYLRSEYPQLKGAFDLYLGFVLKALGLLKTDGRYGWIVPNKIMIAEYAAPTLAKLEKETLDAVVDVSTFEIFAGVGVYPVIVLGDMSRPAVSSRKYKVEASEQLQSFEQHQAEASTLNRFQSLDDHGIKIMSGTTGFEAQKVKELLNEEGRGLPFAVSGNVDPYSIDTSRVSYMKRTFERPHIQEGLQEIASSKYEFWRKPKIVIAGMTKRIEAVYVRTPMALGVGIYAIYDFAEFDPLALTAILNSRFMSHYLRVHFQDKHLAGGYLAINKSTISALPLVSLSASDSEELKHSSAVSESLTSDLIESSARFTSNIMGRYKIRRWPRKLREWWRVDFDELYNTLKLNLGLSDREELMTYFHERARSCREVESKRTAALESIERTVWRIYGVTEGEVLAIETEETG